MIVADICFRCHRKVDEVSKRTALCLACAIAIPEDEWVYWLEWNQRVQRQQEARSHVR